MFTTYITTLFLVCLSFVSTAGQELLGNSDFEGEHSVAPWHCNGCRTSLSTVRYHGQHSVYVHGRGHNWAGITQTFSVQGSHHYTCRGYIKLEANSAGNMYDHLHMKLKYNTPDGKIHYIQIADDRFHQAGFDWEEFGGDFFLPSGVTSAQLYIEINQPSVNYYFDQASCQQITHDSQWQSHSNQRIESLRKADLSMNLSLKTIQGTGDVTVEIKQTSSKFAFGTAVKAGFVSDSNHQAYQDFIYKNFEWAVVENALKWRLMEWTRGHPDYNKGLDGVKALQAHGIKVRGHNMFWAGVTHQPKWLTTLSKTDVLQDMHHRVNEMMSRYRGRLEHWDVNNENLHGDFFEQTLGNANITYDMFRWMHSVDSNVKLFLNEFNVVNLASSTTAYKNQALRLKTSRVPIYGVGVQSHFKSSNINMDVLKYRLDKVAEAGLPIWITELTILEADENKKASALDDVMTMYFSHPAVEGVLLWGFWDSAIYNQVLSLATGSNVTPNVAGRKWIELYHQRFRTNTEVPLSGKTSLSTRVFQGDYQLSFKRNGGIIHTENVTVGDGGNSVNVSI